MYTEILINLLIKSKESKKAKKAILSSYIIYDKIITNKQIKVI